MKCTVHIVSFIYFLFTLFVGVYSDCTYKHLNNPDEKDAVQKLKPLVGRRYQVDFLGYTYHVGICVSATDGGSQDSPDQAVIQVDTKTNGKTYNLGKFTDAEIMGGTNWVYLEYRGGDAYGSHCTSENKRTIILITCDPDANDNDSPMKLIEEENSKDSSCYYLFEMGHPEVCQTNTASGGLSVGSIVLIVFVCVVGVYLIAGAIYQRFVLGAKGMEQIPNYEFWKDFGNLQADGCNFVCRSNDSRNSSPHKGLGDDMIEEAEERDDNLLPM